MELAFDTNEERDKIFQIFSRLKSEYNGQAFKDHKKLTLLNLDVDSLPRNIRDPLEICATFSQVLGLEHVNKHSLMIRNTEMLLQGHHIHERQFENKMNGIKVKKILKDLENESSIIKRMCEGSLDDHESLMKQNKKNAASAAFLEEKLKTYNDKVSILDVTIAEMEPNFDFKEILDLDKHLKSMDEEIRGLQSKLDVYRNLPPNMILAEEKLKEEKLKLEKCEEDLANFIDNFSKALK